VSDPFGRAPLVVFGAVEATALVLWMVLGRSLWFYNDEWDFIVTRKAGDLGELFRPHNEHWLTPSSPPRVCVPGA